MTHLIITVPSCESYWLIQQSIWLFLYIYPSRAYGVTNLCTDRTDILASPRKSLPHGYIAQSASDLMLFTNPLVQDTLPPDWESRQAT